jgi:hypothetical protein
MLRNFWPLSACTVLPNLVEVADLLAETSGLVGIRKAKRATRAERPVADRYPHQTMTYLPLPSDAIHSTANGSSTIQTSAR